MRFDLGGSGTYYTRPMSEGWSKLRDIDPLADGQAGFDFAIPLAEFTRLRSQLARVQGDAQGHIGFARELGLPVADVSVTADVPLQCQRCLEPMIWRVESQGRVAVIAAPEQADRSPEGLETTLAPENRIDLRDLVEEELLLSLPIAPLHDPGDCEATAESAQQGGAASEPAAEERQRPFEQLGELLKRGKTE